MLNVVRYRVLNSCRIWSPTGLTHTPPPPPPSHTLSVYTLLWHREGGRGRGRWTKENIRGAIVDKAGSKIPTWQTGSPIHISNKHLPQSPSRGKLDTVRGGRRGYCIQYANMKKKTTVHDRFRKAWIIEEARKLLYVSNWHLAQDSKLNKEVAPLQ